MIASIIPLIRLPIGKDSFDYLISKDVTVTIGQLARITFNHQEIWGVVASIKEKTNVPVGKLQAIQSLGPVWLTDQQLKLADTVAKEGQASLATTLSTIVPILPKKEQVTTVIGKKTAIPQPIFKDFKLHKQLTYLRWRSFNCFNDWLLKIIGSFPQGQRLILVPTKDEGERVIKVLSKEIKTVFIHSDLKDTEKRIIWQELLTGKTKIVVCTRLGLFYPFPNLHCIFIDQEDSEHYLNKEQKPYYDARTVTGQLAKLTGAAVIASSPAPSLTSYKLPSQLVTFNGGKGPQITTLELTGGLLDNPTIKEKIIKTIQQGKSVLVYHNRLGYNRFTTCRDCGYLLGCDVCKLPLKFSNRHNGWLCYRHEGVVKAGTCPVCHGVSWLTKSWGKEKIADVVKQWLGEEKLDALVLEIDKEVGMPKQWPYKPMVIVSTKTNWMMLPWEQIGLIFIPLLELDMNRPDQLAILESYQTISYFYALLNKDGELLIQTFDPQQEIIKTVVKDAYRDLYRKEKNPLTL
ncbi:MAG: hypothetical protein V1707_02150 [bacterium]